VTNSLIYALIIHMQELRTTETTLPKGYANSQYVEPKVRAPETNK